MLCLSVVECVSEKSHYWPVVGGSVGCLSSDALYLKLNLSMALDCSSAVGVAMDLYVNPVKH